MERNRCVLAAYFAARGAPFDRAAALGGVAAFCAIKARGPGSVLAGVWAVVRPRTCRCRHALTLQTSLGFALTAFTMWSVAEVVERVDSWGVAFALLAIGPALGVRAMIRLQRLRGRGRG